MEEQARMVKQIIIFSDGTETVINYNKLGEVLSDEVETAEEVIEEESISEEVLAEAELVEEASDGL